MGIFTQKRTHKSDGVKTTKYTNKKTGRSKTLIERVKPRKTRKK